MKSSGMQNFKKRLNKKELLTIPNFMSLFRLLLIPIISVCCLKEKRYYTILLIVVSALTDVADGFVARRFNMTSDIGKMLDPIADKLTLIALIICIALTNKKLFILLAFMLLKEGVLITLGYISLKACDDVNSSKWYGKLCTAVLYSSFAVYILFPSVPYTVDVILLLLCCLVVVLSTILYILMYRKLYSEKAEYPTDLVKIGENFSASPNKYISAAGKTFLCSAQFKYMLSKRRK